MDVALIAPLDMINQQFTTDVQLMLPQIKHPDYVKEYREMQQRGDTIILDNGAAERVNTTGTELLKIAHQYKVSEVAIPDTLGNAVKTLDQADHFFRYFPLSITTLHKVHGTQFGVVAQGDNWAASMALVDAVMERDYSHLIDIVYLPKLLLNDGDRYARIRLAEMINTKYNERLVIHLFGANKSWPMEVNFIAMQAPFVRSIDTSLPFAAAMQGVRLSTNASEGMKIGRAEDYFESHMPYEQKVLAAQNIATYLEWAQGE
jgi:hypothetical protein